jgi:G6PDH family F420-dependent oxidoreductase
LNEHVLGAKWPAPDERLEMLEEAVEVIRLLWQGGYQTHRGEHYTVDRARLYTLPDEPPEICVAAAQPNAAELAGRIGDGFIGVAPEGDLIEKFEEAGGSGPRYGHLTGCWAESEDEATRTAHENWPNAGLEGPLNQELATPADFEAVAEMVEPEDLETLPLGPDADRWLEAIAEFEEAGYDHVYIHQIGADQEGFLAFAERELLPRV